MIVKFEIDPETDGESAVQRMISADEAFSALRTIADHVRSRLKYYDLPPDAVQELESLRQVMYDDGVYALLDRCGA